MSTVPLAKLSSKQCIALFHSLEFHAFDEVFQQKEITGEDLSYVETENDIMELGIKVPKIQLKKIFHRIKAWQEQGVSLNGKFEKETLAVVSSSESSPTKPEAKSEKMDTQLKANADLFGNNASIVTSTRNSADSLSVPLGSNGRVQTSQFECDKNGIIGNANTNQWQVTSTTQNHDFDRKTDELLHSKVKQETTMKQAIRYPVKDRWTWEHIKGYLNDHSSYDGMKGRLRYEDMKHIKDFFIKKGNQCLLEIHLETISLLLKVMKGFRMIEPEVMLELIGLIHQILVYCHDNISSRDKSELSFTLLKIIECKQFTYDIIRICWRILSISGIPISAIELAFKMIQMHIKDLEIIHYFLQSLQFLCWPRDVCERYSFQVADLLFNFYEIHEDSLAFINHKQLQENLQKLLISYMSDAKFYKECIRIGGSSVLLRHLSAMLGINKNYVKTTFEAIEDMLQSQRSSKIFASIVNQRTFTYVDNFVKCLIRNAANKLLVDGTVPLDVINFVRVFSKEGEGEAKAIIASSCVLYFEFLRTFRNHPNVVQSTAALLSSVSGTEKSRNIMVYKAKALDLYVELLQQYLAEEKIVLPLFSLLTHLLDSSQHIEYYCLIPNCNVLIRCIDFHIKNYLLSKLGFVILKRMLRNHPNCAYTFSIEYFFIMMTNAYSLHYKDKEVPQLQLNCMKDVSLLLRAQRSPINTAVLTNDKIKTVVGTMLIAMSNSEDSPNLTKLKLDVLLNVFKVARNISTMLHEELIDKGAVMTLHNVMRNYRNESEIILQLCAIFQDIAQAPKVLQYIEKFKVYVDFMQILKMQKERHPSIKTIKEACDRITNLFQTIPQQEQGLNTLTTTSTEEGNERNIDETNNKRRKLNPT